MLEGSTLGTLVELMVRAEILAGDKATVTIAPGQTVARSFSFLVKNSTPGGTYLVTATASDDTGSVSQSGSFNVT